ncbi:DNA repair protein RecN [Candidatus Omnitrophota bacterium]
MLTFLSVSNYALIDQLQVDLSKGFTVLTGETGAGKSILLGALCLVLGEKIGADSFRNQEAPVRVEVSFDLSGHTDICAKTEEITNVTIDDSREVIIRREIHYQGKNRAFLNGSLIPIASLKQISKFLIDIHGQHDHQLLFDRQWHAVFVDDFGGFKKEIEAFSENYRVYLSVLRDKKICDEQEINKARELDILNFQINEIERVELVKDEDFELEHEKIKLANAENLARLGQGVYSVLYEGDTSAIERLNAALGKLRELAKIDETLGELSGLVEKSYIEIDEIAREVQKYLSELSFDEDRLGHIHSRLEAISRLKAKYGVTTDEILSFLDENKKRRDDLTSNEDKIREYELQIVELEKDLSARAEKLHDKRIRIAKKLKDSIEGELKELHMKDARLEIAIEKGDFNPRGYDSVEFLISTNKGESLKPLSKIASGGEVARIMLAFKKILARVDQVVTIIFDEIDANIGGRLGKTVGEKIQEIARDRQVLLVTHLPQIAACADSHFKVLKEHREGRTMTTCVELGKEERVTELAHMMSGHDITTISKQHAEEMIVSSNVASG